MSSPGADATVVSDCDSEGRDPPQGNFVEPTSENIAGPPRATAEVQLPLFRPRPRRPLRELFESKISYEDWVAPVDAIGIRSTTGREKRLEEDSAFPVGRHYFWHAFCPKCHINYHPHIPGMWMCTQCKERVWQQADDPESKNCALCRRKVAPIRKIRGVQVRNPMSLNAHWCKRCGRIVCDQCYSPATISLEEYGYAGDQRVCLQCLEESKLLPPEEEDLGTLEGGEEFIVEDKSAFSPFWNPRCGQCNITYVHPPKRWLCTSCNHPVWQPKGAEDSKTCWICGMRNPKVQCHRCGRLVCEPCGAFAQPLRELGWDTGFGLTVCRCCYGGISIRPNALPEMEEVFPETWCWRGSCKTCGKVMNKPPDLWQSACHNQPVWQPDDAATSNQCASCDMAISRGTREHCRRCGLYVCITCSQYKQPLPQRGYPKDQPQIICKVCFNPRLLLEPCVSDYDFWPPECKICEMTFPEPPPRWQCPNLCGVVWQPRDHVASAACCTCGRKVVEPVNCRVCGRIVCTECGSHRADVVERGFTKGVPVPVCSECFKKLEAAKKQQSTEQQPAQAS